MGLDRNTNKQQVGDNVLSDKSKLKPEIWNSCLENNFINN